MAQAIEGAKRLNLIKLYAKLGGVVQELIGAIRKQWASAICLKIHSLKVETEGIHLQDMRQRLDT